jgi:hypothetical protein
MPSRTTYPTVEQHKAALAAEAWAPLIDFIVATGPRRSHVFGELGLTPNDGRALGSLDPVIGRSMRSLAGRVGLRRVDRDVGDRPARREGPRRAPRPRPRPAGHAGDAEPSRR